MKRVLLVDDEKSTGLLFEACFKAEKGYQFNFVSGGDKCLDFLKNQKEKPDIILLDVMMPEKDGFRVCSEIRKIKKYSKIKIFMFTALNNEIVESKAKKAGADGCIEKSLGLKSMLEKIKSLA